MKTKIHLQISLILLLNLVVMVPVWAVKHTVLVGSYFFNPNSLNVAVGDTVRWQWSNGSHTTTSAAIPAGASAWDHIINSSNQFFEYKVTVAGVYNYVCTPHAAMGQIGSFTAAAPAPTLSLSPGSRSVPQGSGTTTFNVVSNSTWTAVSDAVWCTVTSSGSGNGVITATYTTNATYSPRTANIAVSVDGLPVQTVTVSQDASTVGIDNKSLEHAVIYPNPTEGRFTVSVPGAGDQRYEVTLLDVTGKSISTGFLDGNDLLSFDLSASVKGIYFIRLKNSEESLVRKVIVK